MQSQYGTAVEVDRRQESLRVAVLCHGDDTNARDLIRTLVATDGIEPVVVTDSEEPFPEVAQGNVYRTRLVRRSVRLLAEFTSYESHWSADLLEEIDPDVVMSLGAAGLWDMTTVSGFGPTVFLPQGFETDRAVGGIWDGGLDWIRYRVYRFLFERFLDHVAEVWTQAHAWPVYESLGLSPEQFVDFDWGPVDTSQFAPDVEPVEYVDDPETLVVGTFRRLRELEMLGPSYETILDGVARLVDRGRDVHLVVGGYGFEENDVEAFIDDRIETLGLEDRVTRVDIVPKSELAGYYAGLDVYVNPTYAGTRVGGIGTGSKEAMACGCAFLTMNDPPMDYLIDHRENGLLVDHGDDEAFARELERLCENPAELASLSAAARETVVERFSRAAVGERMKQRCEELESRA